MDYTPLLEQLHSNANRAGELLVGRQLLLCCGNRLVLCFLAASLGRPGIRLAATTTEAEASQLGQRLTPDLVICTDRLEQGCGASLISTLKALHPASRTLLLLDREPPRGQLRRAVLAGCDGLCLASRMGLGSGIAAVQTVLSGGLYLDRQLGGLLDPALDPAPGGGGPQALSERELAVLAEVVEGHNNAEIGRRLYVGEETVKTHLRHLITKLGARNRTHAAVLALRLGLVD